MGEYIYQENDPAKTILGKIRNGDIDASPTKAESLAEKTISPKTEIMGTG